jgi:uncharacterized protein (DUF58 family)
VAVAFFMILQKDLVQLGNLELMARQVVEGFITGLHKSPYHGFSVEFAEHRQYNPGQSTKNIDWKLFARTERLYIKRYEEETNLRCHILLDTSASMYYPNGDWNKEKFSILAAASIMNLLKRQRDAIGLSFFSDKLELQTDVKSSNSHHINLLQLLAKQLSTDPKGKRTEIVPTLHQIAEQIHRRSMIVLFSDMFDQHPEDELFGALQHLKYNKHEVIVFHTSHHGLEKDFDFENRPYTFVDMESGEKVKLFPDEVRDSYREKTSEFYEKIRLKCTQYHIDFVEADVSKTLDQILLPFLVKRQKMRG